MWLILIIIIFILSIYLSYKLNFKNYKLNIKELIKKDKTSFCLTLGTKIGVGSIIGSVSSILIGGFSSVIWIILFSLLTTSIIYYESYYGNKYKRFKDNDYFSGPFFIIRYGLNNKYLAYISLFLLIIVYSFLFQMIQFNTISYILINKLYISKIIIVLFSMFILLITINLSIKDILSIMNKLVPYMCLLFIIISILIIIKHINLIDLNIIYKDIFNTKSVFIGLIIGVKRSIFMNELLIGTTSTSIASDKNSLDISIKYQILGSFFISIVITLLVSLLLLVYMSTNNITNDYNLLIYNIFNLLNNFGTYSLLIIYLLFGFTTVLSGYYIGKSNIEYLTNNRIIINIFKILFIIFCILGIIVENSVIWKYIDIFIFIMIIINLYSIIKLVMSDDR